MKEVRRWRRVCVAYDKPPGKERGINKVSPRPLKDKEVVDPYRCKPNRWVKNEHQRVTRTHPLTRAGRTPEWAHQNKNPTRTSGASGGFGASVSQKKPARWLQCTLRPTRGQRALSNGNRAFTDRQTNASGKQIPNKGSPFFFPFHGE